MVTKGKETTSVNLPLDACDKVVGPYLERLATEIEPKAVENIKYCNRLISEDSPY